MKNHEQFYKSFKNDNDDSRPFFCPCWWLLPWHHCKWQPFATLGAQNLLQLRVLQNVGYANERLCCVLRAARCCHLLALSSLTVNEPSLKLNLDLNEALAETSKNAVEIGKSNPRVMIWNFGISKLGPRKGNGAARLVAQRIKNQLSRCFAQRRPCKDYSVREKNTIENKRK